MIKKISFLFLSLLFFTSLSIYPANASTVSCKKEVLTNFNKIITVEKAMLKLDLGNAKKDWLKAQSEYKKYWTETKRTEPSLVKLCKDLGKSNCIQSVRDERKNADDATVHNYKIAKEVYVNLSTKYNTAYKAALKTAKDKKVADLKACLTNK